MAGLSKRQHVLAGGLPEPVQPASHVGTGAGLCQQAATHHGQQPRWRQAHLLFTRSVGLGVGPGVVFLLALPVLVPVPEFLGLLLRRISPSI